jgi:hypothetical protein
MLSMVIIEKERSRGLTQLAFPCRLEGGEGPLWAMFIQLSGSTHWDHPRNAHWDLDFYLGGRLMGRLLCIVLFFFIVFYAQCGVVSGIG